MRPGQNKRMRGRNNNNNNSNGGGGHRRGPNPLTRSYESNGPDVKIRGTAQHIGEKYLQLARDAQTSGDPVAAENYLQHAEHYFRIIAAAQQAQQQAQPGYARQPGDTESDDADGDDEVMMPDRFSLPSERFAQPTGTGQQPYADRAGFNGERTGVPERAERPQGQENGYRAERQDREPRVDRDQRQDREPRQDRDQRQERDTRQDRPVTDRPAGDQRPAASGNAGERAPYEGDKPYRNDRGTRPQRTPRYPRDGQDYRERNERAPQEGRDQRDTRDPSVREQPRIPEPIATVDPEIGSDLPAFITAPVRSVVPAAPPVPEPVEVATQQSPTLAAESPQPAAEAVADAAPEAEGFAVRPRRRRRTRAAIEADAAAAQAAGEVDSE
ncbi:DUF4167 domain-containing protein [Lichenifustis flavocetrariae]|uniref:DUF4167 domain-containing protein n=1 Tax=Lichenifustis flavocetrariae TaxID=2949735 RepID=A0AA42CJT4_9HYPH|nr:DUF4167 domain-containing protein [Lichenifustis flavocetrariae]MCW6509888.1 DUF4167 domain-containing protein [Lichenifustis flavocetrariae]